MRVLLVEDSVDVTEAINAHLVRLCHTVDWESDGTKAVSLVIADHYDLIILDVMLPGVDGYSLLQRVRKVPRNHQRVCPERHLLENLSGRPRPLGDIQASREAVIQKHQWPGCIRMHSPHKYQLSALSTNIFPID